MPLYTLPLYDGTCDVHLYHADIPLHDSLPLPLDVKSVSPAWINWFALPRSFALWSVSHRALDK
jgi:hypothetical protein